MNQWSKVMWVSGLLYPVSQIHSGDTYLIAYGEDVIFSAVVLGM